MTDVHKLSDEEKRVLWAVQFKVVRSVGIRAQITGNKNWFVGDTCVDASINRLHKLKLITGDRLRIEWELTPLGRSYL